MQNGLVELAFTKITDVQILQHWGGYTIFHANKANLEHLEKAHREACDNSGPKKIYIIRISLIRRPLKSANWKYMPFLNIMKMSKSSLQDQTNIPLIVTTNEAGNRPSSSTGNSLDSSFKAKSCRSFRAPKLNIEHRNKSVPQNLQVYNDEYEWNTKWPAYNWERL